MGYVIYVDITTWGGRIPVLIVYSVDGEAGGVFFYFLFFYFFSYRSSSALHRRSST